MQAERLSAGVVIVRRVDADYRYLLLRAFRYWDFPKGEVEDGETPRHAAEREVLEETSLEGLRFLPGAPFVETPPYGRGKVARYYLAESASGAVRLRVNPQLGRPEHHEFRWLGYEHARALLVPRVAHVLDWAKEQLEARRAQC